jgi:hypothetical protein
MRVHRSFANIMPFDRRQAQLAGQLAILTQNHGRSLGDRACLAAGIVLDARVLTADTAWRKLSPGVEIVLIRKAPISESTFLEPLKPLGQPSGSSDAGSRCPNGSDGRLSLPGVRIMGLLAPIVAGDTNGASSQGLINLIARI